MRWSEITEGRDALLYHGYSDPENFAHAMQRDAMLGTTTQRWWDDGKRRKDDDPEYETSNWMKGLSFTRDPRFAMQWGRIMIAVDQRIIAQRHQMVPFNWGYSIPDHNYDGGRRQEHKREREEFAVTHKGDQYRREDGTMDQNRFRQPEGEITGLSKYLRGIWLDRNMVWDDPEDRHPLSAYFQRKMKEAGMPVSEIITHPLFKGYYRGSWFLGQKKDGKGPNFIQLDAPPLIHDV